MKKTITITLHIGEIVYDVANKTDITGDTKSNGENYELVSHIKSSNSDESANQIMRSVGNAIASLKSKVGEYLEDASSAGDNVLHSGEDEVIVLHMPMNWNEAANESVANAMHSYIVNMATGEWLNLTDKQDSAEYFKFAANSLGELREAINKRNRPDRPIVEDTELGLGIGLGN